MRVFPRRSRQRPRRPARIWLPSSWRSSRRPVPQRPGAREGRGFGRDLNLTDAQKAQIKAIHQKYQPQNQALRDRAKPFMEAARAARQKGDTAAFRSNMAQAQQIMQSGQSFRTQEKAEIRAILTPEQQAKFDARQKAASERRAKGGKKGWGRKGNTAPPAVKQ